MSETVKRYNLWRVDYDGRECDPLKEEDERGDWVTADDYARLEQEHGNLKRDLAQITFALSNEQQAYIKLRDERDDALKQVDLFLEAITQYEVTLRIAYPNGATGDAFVAWNAARQALQAEP